MEKKLSIKLRGKIYNIFCFWLSDIHLYFYVRKFSYEGVIEEKTNRIVEVIISSVKPFQLLLGKIIGVASWFTQFILWIILSLLVLNIVSSDISKNNQLGIFEITNHYYLNIDIFYYLIFSYFILWVVIYYIVHF